MRKTDMSPKAVTARLKRTDQLRRLGLSLRKAKFKPQEVNSEVYKPIAPTKPAIDKTK